MDKLFRKRTTSNARSDSSSQPREHRFRKDKVAALPKRAAAPLPRLPPSLDIDIRNSLILPSLTQRFSVLLPGLTAAPDQTVRSLLAQQRGRNDGPSLTLEEEELLIAELRGDAPSVMSGISEWDGNPPPLDGDWGYGNAPRTGSLAGSMSSPSVRSRSGSDLATLSTSARGSATQLSPSGSFTPLAPVKSPSYSTFGGERIGPRSYGFSSSAGFRDNNYLRKVTKTAGKPAEGVADTPTPHHPSPPRRKPLPDMYPPMPTLTDREASSSSPSSSSDRTALPSAHVSTASIGGRSVTSPVTSTPQSLVDEVLIQRPQKTTPLDARGPHPRQRLHQLQQPQQRQSLMMGLSPAQAQRISMALLELESHLVSAVEVPEEPSRGAEQGSYVVLNDQEEILDGDGGDPIVLDRVPSITSTSASSSVFPFTVSPTSSAHGGSASVAPSTAAPPTPVSKPPSLPSSPRTLNLQAMQSSAGQSPTLPSASFPAVPAGMQSPSPSPAASAPEGADMYRADDSTRVSSATTSLSETDYQVPAPALKPFRPQPVRHTPSPAFGVTSGYVPGQPRPVGSRHGGHGSFSSKSSTPPFGSPLSPSAMNGIGQLPTRAPFPSAPTGQRRSGYSALQGGVQLARSHSATQGSNAGSRSNTPTQSSKVGHVPAPGVLAARHQASHSIGEFNSWRSGSSLGVHSPTKAVIIEDEQAERSASSDSSRPPHTEITSNLYSHGSIGRTSEAIGLFPMKDPSAQPLAPLQRVRTHESTSSTFSMPGMDDSALWDSMFRDRPFDHAAVITPNDDQDRADLDLLRSMSGMGKDELMAIQGRLVENAKSERDRLRSERDEDVTPSPQPSQPPLSASETHVPVQKSSAAASAASLPATLSKSPAWPMPPTSGPAVRPAVRPAEPAPPARLDNGVTAPSPGPPTSPSQFPTQHVPRSELPRGPPPMRPQPPPANISPVPVSAASMSPTVVTPSSLPPWAAGIASPTGVASPAAASPTGNTNGQSGHDRSASGGKTWLDDDPDARRDIEERIQLANSSLFRAPSRSAHKRSLSKKQISSPTLVSYSAKVPTTPIASIPGVGDQGSLGKKAGEKGSSGHKLSGRWRKLGFKRPSISGAEVTPFMPPMPPATAPLSGPLATTPRQQQQQTAQPTPPASLSRKPEGTDLHGFRFPHAPDGVPGSQNGGADMPAPNGVVPRGTQNTPHHDAPNGRAVPTHASPVLASQPQSRTPPQHLSALPSQSPPVALTRGSPGGDARTAPTAEVRPASPKGQRSKPLTGAALQAITNPNLDKVVSRRTHGTTPSDASIDKFIQAGREVGFDDERLNEILASNGVRHSDASSSLSRLSSAPLSFTGARSSPKAAPRLTLGWGHGDIDASQFVISQFDSPPPTQPFFDKSQLDQVASSFDRPLSDRPLSERSISGRLHPPARIPSTVDESPRITERALSEPRASSDIDPSILRRTIVMVDEAATPGAPLSPQVSRTGGNGGGGGGRKLPPSPLQLADNDAVPTTPVSPTTALNGTSNGKAAPFQRGNSIRRKPVPLANIDKQPVEPNPRPGLHIRTESNTSDAMSSLVSPSPHYDGSHYYGNSEPASATSSGFPHSTSSFLDYYNGDSPVSETFDRGSQFGSQQFNRGSQGLEITEYADGRVVWNIVNALRSDAGHGSTSEDHTNNQQELQRGSVLSTQSQTSNYTGSQRESQPPERLSEVAEGGLPANGPWRVGPTAGLSFMRRPETKVYYTSSADVADLIDQLSGDATGGATRGRIDIRPTQMGVPQYGALGFGPGQFDDADLAPGAAQDLSTSTATLSPLKQRRLRPDLEQNFTAQDVQSPSAQSFGSDLSGGGSASVGHGGMERSVEDRLQALMDRLRAAPGGVSGVVVE